MCRDNHTHGAARRLYPWLREPPAGKLPLDQAPSVLRRRGLTLKLASVVLAPDSSAKAGQRFARTWRNCSAKKRSALPENCSELGSRRRDLALKQFKDHQSRSEQCRRPKSPGQALGRKLPRTDSNQYHHPATYGKRFCTICAASLATTS